MAFTAAHPTGSAFISPCTNGYTTMFAERLDSFEEHDLLETTAPICVLLGCSAIALSVIQSDHLYAWAFDQSGRLAAWVSTRGAGLEIPDSERRHQFALIAELAGRSGAAPLLERCFDEYQLFADWKLMKVTAALGISHFGYTYTMLVSELAELDEDCLPGVAEFLAVKP